MIFFDRRGASSSNRRDENDLFKAGPSSGNRFGPAPGRIVRDLALLIGLTLALHIPFAGMAFHLDDVQYLEVARNVFRNPLFPLDLPTVFEGQHMTLWGHTHPPLNSYFISGAMLLNHRAVSEVFLHSAFLVFPLILTVSFYFLARRFGRSPLMLTALVAANPTLVVCAHTLMADVPFLAMWTCGTLLFVTGVDRDKNGLLYGSALPLAGACFYAYPGLALVPLLGFYALTRKRLRLRQTVVLLLPVILMAGWQFSGYVHRGVIYASTMFGYLGVRGLWLGTTKVRTAIATLTYLGGTILPFPFIFWRIGFRWKGILAWIGLTAGVLVAFEKLAGYTVLEKAFFLGCFAGGMAALIWVLALAVRSLFDESWGSDDVFLSLWFVGMLVTSVVAFFSGSARYVLPTLPPLLLLFDRAKRIRVPIAFGRMLYPTLLVAQVILGLGLAYTDYEFAGTGRREARDFETRYLSKDEPFLFSGEWGFRYYLTAIGGDVMAGDSTASPRELVVKSRLCLGQTFDNELDRSLRLLDQRSYRIRSPIRLLAQDTHAGFWSDGWGVLPFWFSTRELDVLSVYRVPEK